MATKNLLPLVITVLCAHSWAQKLEPRSECTFHSQSTVTSQGTITTTQIERCVEEPGVEIAKLRIGDTVRASQLPKHPVIDIDFYYRQTKCRWFAQAQSVQKDLVQYQGIACLIQPNVWRIIDKF